MLDSSKAQSKSQGIRTIMRDLNVKIGEEMDGKMTGKFGLETRNEAGEKWGPMVHGEWPGNNQHRVSRTSDLYEHEEAQEETLKSKSAT